VLEEKTVKTFLDELASGAPTPGGGSAAAVIGATGAALLSMACNLTVGKKAYAEVEGEMLAVLERSEALRFRLEGMVQADIQVFEQVMAAYGMVRGTDDEKAARKDAIQYALKAATLVPMECARACAEVIELADIVARKGNRNVVSDAGVGVAAAHAALRSAALNVYINTASIDDSDFARAQLEELDDVLERAGQKNEAVYADVIRALE